MQYIQRNFAGQIVGLYSGPQPQEDGTCLTEPDPLPDDHPEVLQFREEHPLPKFETSMPTRQEAEEALKKHERLSSEVGQLQNLMLIHFQEMAHLELALGALLQQILNIQGNMPNVARAIYFSIPGFDQRCKTVSKALEQFVIDHICADREKYAELESVDKAWSRITAYLTEVRKTRNIVAHGGVSSIPYGGKHNARLMAPAFDPIRVGNLLAKGSNPGIGADDLQKAIIKMKKVSGCVDRMNETIVAFHQFGLEAMQKAYSRLEKNIQALESL